MTRRQLFPFLLVPALPLAATPILHPVFPMERWTNKLSKVHTIQFDIHGHRYSFMYTERSAHEFTKVHGLPILFMLKEFVRENTGIMYREQDFSVVEKIGQAAFTLRNIWWHVTKKSTTHEVRLFTDIPGTLEVRRTFPILLRA